MLSARFLLFAWLLGPSFLTAAEVGTSVRDVRAADNAPTTDASRRPYLPTTEKSLINIRDLAQVRARRPLLIAHRGGVVTPQIPECSLAAIREAARFGYDMIELDVRATKDGRPVIFHDRTLLAACGVDTTIGALNEAEARAIRYRKNGEPIATLAEALALLRQLNLGLMLDFKDATLRPEFLRIVAALVREHGLAHASVTISGNPLVRTELRDVALVPVTADELKRIAAGETIPAAGLYWFGIPAWIDFAAIPKLQRAGALVFPAINTFRYENDPDRSQARADVARLQEIGVEGFQIDAAYQDFFGRPLPAAH